MAIPELQEVVIQRLLTDADVLGGLFQSYPLFGIHAPPLTYLNHNFTDYALLLPAASKGLARLSTTLDECISVLSSGPRSKLQLYLVDPLGQSRYTAFSFRSSRLHQSEVEQVGYCLFGSGGAFDLSLGDLFRFLLIDIKLFHGIRFGRLRLLGWTSGTYLVLFSHFTYVNVALHLWTPVGYHLVFGLGT